MNIWSIINIILIIIIIAYFLYQLYLVIWRSRIAKLLSEEDFNAGMRKAQIIDLREKKDFDAGHIMGARNVPYSTLKARYGEIRQDLPVYLYDQGRSLSTHAAITLSRKGYQELFILKSGYARWNGKTKQAK